MADLGRAALVTAFLLLVYACVAGSFAAWRGRRRLAASAQNALLAAFAASAVAFVWVSPPDFASKTWFRRPCTLSATFGPHFDRSMLTSSPSLSFVRPLCMPMTMCARNWGATSRFF